MARKANSTEVLDVAGKVVSSNPASIMYPTDPWGLTTELKASVRTLAARVCGCPEKYKVVQETLEIVLAHLEARYNEDNARLHPKEEINAAEKLTIE